MQCIIRAVAAETTAVFAESKFKVATLQDFIYIGFAILGLQCFFQN